ncbi:MAG: PorT family protein [Cyclobacteriaceae bacterium]
MRKFIIIVALISVSLLSNAQSKLGLKFSPIISSNRVALVDSLYDVKSSGSNGTFSVGLIYDHEITETYFLSTGLIFLPKKTSFSVSSEEASTPLPSGLNPRETYRLQYLQVPITLKLFTNEVMPDGRVFFQVGTALEVLVNNEPMKEDYDLVKDFKNTDFSVILGSGFEYRAGINTTLFAEVSYQRGLVNQIKALRENFQEELFIRSNIVAIDLGIKF